MDLSTTLGLVAVAVLVLTNGFFVATEFAIVAVRKSRLEQLAAEGHPTAASAKELVSHLDTYIAACQLGITMASLGLGWIGEPAFAHLVEPPLEAIVGQFAPAAAHGVAVGISFTIITALHIVIGELAPKGLALQRPESTTLWVTQPMRIFEYAFRWPIRLLNGIGNSVLKLFGLHPTSGHEMVHSVEELRVLVHAARQAGGVEESEARIASRAFTFADLTAGALMTPRTELDAVPVNLPARELRARLATSPHWRIPVYESSPDHILGVLHATDFYHVMDRELNRFLGSAPDGGSARDGALEEHLDRLDVRSLLRPVMAVPETKPADDLLDEMRAARRHFAVVVDEYGGTAGVVTIDDLLAALVGPIEQETPVAVDGEAARGDPVPDISAAEDGSLLVDGLVRLEEWEEATGSRLPTEDHDAVETLGGLVMTRLGRMPEVGDEVTVAGYVFRVEALDGLRVAIVRARLSTPQTTASTSGTIAA